MSARRRNRDLTATRAEILRNRTALALVLGALAIGGPTLAVAQTLPGGVSAGEGPVQIIAEEVIYNPNTKTVTATGKVEVSQGDRVLMADKITYFEDSRIVAASGNVSLLEPTGEVLFADYVELDDQLREGFVQTIRLLFADDSRAAAVRAIRREGNVTTLDRAVYSPCLPCADKPDRPLLWQVKAVKVTHDQTAKTVEYEDATFEVLGVPVAYTPYFSHPDPSVKRLSGFLAPRIGGSGRLGFRVGMPYFWAIDDNSDLTLTPFITTQAGAYAVGDYRKVFGSGEFAAQFSLGYGEEFDGDGNPTGSDAFRGHIFARGNLQLDDNWRVGLNVERSSSDTYLKRFSFTSPNYLTSDLYAEGFYDRSYFSVIGYSFQGLRAISDPDTTPLVLPLAQANWVLEPEMIGGRLELSANAIAIHRDEGTSQRRFSLGAAWQRPWITDLGTVFTLDASIRGDFYDTEDVYDAAGIDVSGQTARFLPKLSLEARYPLVRPTENGRQVIEPIAQFVLAPSTPISKKISNEDSQSFEFDDTNLFAVNRFSGYDRWDAGSRFVYGVRTAYYGNEGTTFSVFLGESFEFTDEKDVYEYGKGLGDGRSDFVGAITFTPTYWLDLQHNFRLDKDDLSFNRNDIRATINGKRLQATIGYTAVKEQTAVPAQADRDEIYVTAGLKLDEYWTVYGDTRHRLNDDEGALSTGLGLFYTDECVELGAMYRRDTTRDRDVTPDTSVSLILRLRNLGM
ncbi:LPS-assembly protein LptD [Zavarzinia compransoris]|uniref:LPS-assembly protein LptD n=1 Tax=Zavarzinia compransoris TaxID=1264899 RepID=A0A317EEA4_9PROT|nr:LPS assembly protein LptD [Zavarzinia compransoris]PWR23683.1 LPS-assembly protein LptD [Zavarzinia compransoris]TDP47903.1 LPS-assembly protein [Zavarzinia compransoris]